MTESQINVEKEQTEQEVKIEREPFSIGGESHDYTAGEGLKLQDYEFSADTDVLATKSDLIDKQDTLTAGENISIEDNTISATDTTYTAGDNVSIENNTISATDTTYTAGANVSIENNTISATDTTYTAGDNITISDENVISASGGGGGPTVVQTIGTSTTDVMSQNAVRDMVYQPNTSSFPLRAIQIGSGASYSGTVTNGTPIVMGYNAKINLRFGNTSSAVAIGSNSSVSNANEYGVALGFGSTATRQELSVGGGGYLPMIGGVRGRYVSNVLDPALDQDAATKKYVDTAIAALEARIAALEGN